MDASRHHGKYLRALNCQLKIQSRCVILFMNNATVFKDMPMPMYSKILLKIALRCGGVEEPASTDDDERLDEEFNNLFEEFSEELQIDDDIAADEYSNFDHEVCTSFPHINYDEVDWRRVSMATGIQEYGIADDIAIEVETDDDNDEDNENENNVSQISPREAMKLLDRLVHVDGMSVEGTNAVIAIYEKIESLIVQQKRQTYIVDFFPKD